MNTGRTILSSAWLRSLTQLQTRKLSAAWTDSLIIFLCGRVVFTLIGYFIWRVRQQIPLTQELYDKLYYGVPPTLNGWAGALLGVWQRWDAINFQRIATGGYTNDYLTAFFPFYPVLSGLVIRLTHLNPLLVLILVSNLAFYLSLVLLHKIISAQFSLSTARGALAAMLLFPTGFYFYAISPVPVLMLWTALAYWMVRQEHWRAALAASLLAGLTHPTSVLLSVLLGVEVLHYLWPKVTQLRKKRFTFSWSDLPVIGVTLANLAGIGIFMLWRQMAGFMSYVDTQAAAGDRGFYLPWETAILIARYIRALPPDIEHIIRWINVGVFFAVIGLTIWSFRRIPWSWWAFQLAALLFICSNFSASAPLLGFFRYILIVFPIYVEIILLGQKGWAQKTKFVLGLILGFICSALYFMWQGGLS